MKCSTKTREEIKKQIVSEFEETDVNELEQEIQKYLQEMGQEVMGELLSRQDNKYQPAEKCECKGVLRRKEWRGAKVLSVFGWVNYERGYYHCDSCGKRIKLLDKAHNLKPGQATKEMSKLMAMSGVSVSFQEASRQVEAYLGVRISPKTIRKETLAAGERQQEWEETMKSKSEGDALQERERNIPPQNVPETLYGSIDGVQTPLNKGWKEMKMLCWYQQGENYAAKKQQAYGLHYYSSLDQAKDFGKLVWASGVEAFADKAANLIFVCDGAAWIWKLVEQYFPKAIQIVDWYHACQYLYPIAEEAFLDNEQEKQDWLKETKALLWDGKIDAVLAACQRWAPLPSAQDAISYYTNQTHRMDYKRFREAGFFIGSGTIESACKQVVSLRLKRPGARWSSGGAEAVAKARSAWLSGDSHWQRLFLAV